MGGLLGGSGEDVTGPLNSAEGMYGQESAYAGMAGGLGNAAAGNYNMWNPMANTAGTSLYNAYMQRANGMTDQQKALMMGQLGGGFGNPYAAGQNALASNLSARGLAGSNAGGLGSIGLGGNAYMAANAANQMGHNQAQIGQMQYNAPLEYLGMAQQLAGGNAGNAYGQAQQGYGSAMSGYGSAGGGYMNAAQMANQYNQEQQQAMGGGFGSLLGTGLDVYGMMHPGFGAVGGLGSSGGGGSPSANNGITSYSNPSGPYGPFAANFSSGIGGFGYMSPSGSYTPYNH